MSERLDAAIQDHARSIQEMVAQDGDAAEVVLIVRKGEGVSMSAKADSIGAIQELLLQALRRVGWRP